MDNEALAVVVDPLAEEGLRRRWEARDGRGYTWPGDPGEGVELIQKLLGEGKERLAVVGGDRVFGEVITAYLRRQGSGTKNLELWPLPTQETLLGDEVGAVEAGKVSVEALESMNWRRQEVGTLKISASAAQAARYGFSFGTGWVYGAVAALRRARKGTRQALSAIGDLATEGLGDDGGGAQARRAMLDEEVIDTDAGGAVVASTLAESYFGLGHRDVGPRAFTGLTRRSVMREAVTPNALGYGQRKGQGFERLVLDGLKRWVVDGQLDGYEDDGVVAVSAGPVVNVVVPRRGMRDKLSGLLN